MKDKLLQMHALDLVPMKRITDLIEPLKKQREILENTKSIMSKLEKEKIEAEAMKCLREELCPAIEALTPKAWTVLEQCHEFSVKEVDRIKTTIGLSTDGKVVKAIIYQMTYFILHVPLSSLSFYCHNLEKIFGPFRGDFYDIIPRPQATT